MNKKFFLALATLVATIVGVGLFSLPYVASKTNLLTLILYFIGAGVFTCIVQLIYSEIIVKTKGRHQLAGYAEIYLGKNWKTLVFIIQFLSLTGILTAYLIVGGDFLHQLLSPIFGGGISLYVVIYYLLGMFLIYLGLSSIAGSEFVMLVLMIAAVLFLFFAGFKDINFSNLETIYRGNLFLPYGPVLFSLWGITVIPAVVEILGQKKEQIKKIVALGTLISILIYAVFIITILGASGQATSVDALSGIKNIFSGKVMVIALLFGLLTTFTSFISLGETAKEALSRDLKISKNLAWVFSCTLPLVLYFLGIKNFLEVISITGAVLLGAFGIILFSIYFKIKKQNQKTTLNLNLPNWSIYLFILILLSGVITEIFYTLK